MPAPETTPATESQPFERGDDCKHPLHQLRSSGQEQARGIAAKVQFVCRGCDKVWSGSEAVVPILHYSYQAEIRRLERLMIKAGIIPE